jgi:hypothetical protein
LAYLLLGAFNHAMALAGLLIKHLPAAGDLESLLGPGLGLDLGHLALLGGTAASVKATWARARLTRTLPIRAAAEHSTVATAALTAGRREASLMADGKRNFNQRLGILVLAERVPMATDAISAVRAFPGKMDTDLRFT